MRLLASVRVVVFAVSIGLTSHAALGAASSAGANGQSAAESGAAYKARIEAVASAVAAEAMEGPLTVPIEGEASFRVPEGMLWMPKAAAVKLFYAMGVERAHERLAGLLVDPKTGLGAVLMYGKHGHIQSDDAEAWMAKSDEILARIRTNNETRNEWRKTRNVPGLSIDGWAAPPEYVVDKHRLIWSIQTTELPGHDAPQIQYFAYVLGRDTTIGMLSLVKGRDIEAVKARLEPLISGLQFYDGKRYEDFNQTTDRIAEIGVIGLIAGVGAKKLGLFAALAVLLAKFVKPLAVMFGAYGLWKAKMAKAKGDGVAPGWDKGDQGDQALPPVPGLQDTAERRKKVQWLAGFGVGLAIFVLILYSAYGQ